MARPGKREIAGRVVARYPKSHAEELGIRVERNTPAPLYQWLVVCLLFSARISADQAQKAARALLDEGWRSPRKMAATSWDERVRVLNHSGYARYDESTARYLGDTTDLLLGRYQGDLRKLREEAGHDLQRERTLLKEFKGIGEVGVDIFFREAQLAWDELHPFADKRALGVAAKMGLGDNAAALARLVGRRRDLPRLLSGLVRLELEGATNEVRQAA